MKSLPKALLYGFFTWLVPFVAGMFFYSKDGSLLIDIFLFKSIMVVIGALTGAAFLVLYFKKVKRNFLREGVSIGLIWLAINWILDLVVLLPLAKMSIAAYFAQIGLRYLAIPVFSIAIGMVLEETRKSAEK
jgi:uncharacterized membrane protein YpjA